MPSTGRDRRPRTKDELLDDVYGRARQLWWRRRVMPSVTAAIVVVAAALAPVVLRGSDSRRRVAAVTQPSEPTSSTTTTLETPAETATTQPVAAAPSSGAPTTTARRRPTTTTTALVCLNSYDSRCGAFRWDPDPGPNEPSTAQITVTPAQPRVGETVTFHVTYNNPDGPADNDTNDISFGDGISAHMVADSAPPAGGCKTPYGPWTPPTRSPNTSSFDGFSYSYKTAGTFTVALSGNPGADACDRPTNPYRDPKSATTTVTVSP